MKRLTPEFIRCLRKFVDERAPVGHKKADTDRLVKQLTTQYERAANGLVSDCQIILAPIKANLLEGFYGLSFELSNRNHLVCCHMVNDFIEMEDGNGQCE